MHRPIARNKKINAKLRPRDCVFELRIFLESSTLNYFMFNDGAINSFELSQKKQYYGLGDFRLIGQKKTVTNFLKNIVASINLSTNPLSTFKLS